MPISRKRKVEKKPKVKNGRSNNWKTISEEQRRKLELKMKYPTKLRDRVPTGHPYDYLDLLPYVLEYQNNR